MYSEIMRELHEEKRNMNDGDTLYVISYKWWQLWKEAVMYDATEDEVAIDDAGPGVSIVGPIDNCSLLVNRGKGNRNDLRNNLIKDVDYTLLSEQYV